MAIPFDNRYDLASPAEEARLTDYLEALMRNRRLILAITLGTLALAAAYAFIAPPVYRGDVLIQVEDKAANNNDPKQTFQAVSGMFGAKATTAAEIELLKSRLVTEETVKQLHLDIAAQPRSVPVIGGMLGWLAGTDAFAWLSRKFDLGRYAWGEEHIAVSMFDTPGTFYREPFTLVSRGAGAYTLLAPDGAAVLEGRVGEVAHGVTAAGPITLRVVELTGEPGVQFEVTRFSTVTTTEHLQDALKVAETALQSGVISLSLEGRNAQLTADIVNNIARQFLQQDIDRRSAEAEHTLAFLDQQLPQLRAELDNAEQRYNTFRDTHGAVDLGEESRLLLQQTVDTNTKLIDLQQQRAELAQRFTPRHPAVAALDAQIATLQSAQGSMTRRIAGLPDTEQTAVRLMRDVRVDTELYTNLLNSAQALRVMKAGQVGNVRVVDFAEAADHPVRPKRVLVILLGGGIGFAIGVVVALMRRALFGGVERADQIEEALGVPVFAVVPRSEQQLRLQQNVSARRGGQHVLAALSPGDVAVEGVRGLRTTLQLALGDARNNVVMLTGSRPDAGKSFLSVNLATLVASSGKRVLLIDGDMRRGDIHSHFGIPHQPGLSQVLCGADPNSAIQYAVLPNLDVLPKGTLPGHPSELLMNDRFKALLDEMRTRYDLVLIDTPPVLAVTDSTLIGKLAGTTLLVIRHGRHSIDEIAEAVKRLRNGGVPLKGVLLTDVPQGTLPGRYRGGYYSYDGIAE